MKPFFVYILACADGSYYVGHTDDLEQRFAQHQDGTFRGFTSKRRPVTLAWCAELPTRANALERELQLKRWTRAKKEALIREDWNAVKALARGLDRHERIAIRSASPFDSAPGTAGSVSSSAGRYAQGERDLPRSRSASPFDSAPGAASPMNAIPGRYAQGERDFLRSGQADADADENEDA